MSRNKFIIAVLGMMTMLSVSINTLFLLPYTDDIVGKISNVISPPTYWHESDSDSDVISSIIDYTYKAENSKMIMDEHHGLINDVEKYFRKEKRQSHIKNNFFVSYYYAGLSYYALNHNDHKMRNFLIDIATSLIDTKSKSINYPIYVIDQYSIGIFFINLYRMTGKEIYLSVVKNLYKELMLLKDDEGLIKYLTYSPYHYSDEIGMYVPFLMEYFDLTKDKMAIEIVNKNILVFNNYGIDSTTHIPFHGYDKDSKIKLGSSNWGRGIGWYLLGLAYCPQFKDEVLDRSVNKLSYTQFPLTSDHFDSSTALMYEIYKQSKNPNRKLDLSFIKPHIRKNGIVDHFSGDTYAFNDYSHLSGCSELGNGFLLMLITKFSNKSIR